ncbi:hypothetical protein D0Z00_004099 [Geotrichum galactomycetum]|uniref:Uncharacterized protein n=1 Tax=Geotrichum galactomycetum TaxID=27317 RepID=A0ACB6UZD2_9ASCO|nr:hypothetical protein D0Z00_004099 [Geotrichum candidum]
MEGCFDDSQAFIKPIETGVEQALGRNYRQVDKKVIGAVALLVYHDMTRVKIVDSRKAAVRCGMYLSGLKGGVGIRLTVRDVDGADTPTEEFTFVNAHLAANEGVKQKELRNSNFHTIATSLNFNDGYGFYKPGSHLFFMGDLNYRATRESNSGAQQHGEEGEGLLQTLNGSGNLDISRDELLFEIRNQKVLFGFKEAPITFPPTFKYQIGNPQNVYKTNRTPSWCDRIMYLGYKESDSEAIIKYNIIPSVLTSDHKPLYLGIAVPRHETPTSISLTQRQETDNLSLEFNKNAAMWDTVGSKVDLAIGWGLYIVSSTPGRLTLAAILVILFLIYLI